MSAPMKKPRIEEVEIKIGSKRSRLFIVPKDKAESIANLLEDYDQSSLTSISTHDVFKELDQKYSRPGAILKGARLKEELSQSDLAKKLGINQADLSKMENGVRRIGRSMAERLSKILGVDYRVFL